MTERSESRKQSWVRYNRKRRRELKLMAVAFKGGRCASCGYTRSVAALDFHHLDGADKEFGLSSGGAVRSWRRIEAELRKCVLLCANCHRERHASESSGEGSHAVVEWRRRAKQRAVDMRGGHCERCGYRGPRAALEFHHLDPATKEFSISTDGIPRAWSRILTELDKCVLLCANCHRETHAAPDPEAPT